MKTLLKRKINPMKLKVGVTNLKALRNEKLILESNSKEDIEILKNEIEKECSQFLEVNVPKRRNPFVIVYNIPDDGSLENFTGTIMHQNEELKLEEEDVKAKFVYKIGNNLGIL